MCYTCHQFMKACQSDKTEDTDEDTDKEQPTINKREQLPKTVRNALFINYFKDSRKGMCMCCKREEITLGNFQAGHIVAHVNGGTNTLDNLVPICTLCNLSMGTMNLNDFIKKYNLHHGLDMTTLEFKKTLINFQEDTD